MSTPVEFRYVASELARALATCAAVALGVAVLTMQWQLVTLAAPLLGLLMSLRWQSDPPEVRLYARAPGASTDTALVRCFEGDRVAVTVTAQRGDSGPVAVELVPVAGLNVDVEGEAGQSLRVTMSAARWGRYPLRVRLSISARGGLATGTAVVDAAELFVFPVAPAQSTPLPRTELLDRLGTHLVRQVGRGVEYGNIRSYVPGDQLRTVNWPVSARRGSLHVTERLSERAADVVVLVDTSDQPVGPATEAAERTVRGAVQVVQSALRSGDRAGVVALGGTPRWLGADIGRRQFYRILDAIMAAGNDFEPTTGTLAPRAALPAGAIVVAFSTLLDTDFALALIELCRRGHVVVAVDVLDGAPFGASQEPLVHRMWAVQRSFMYRDMRTIGVDVVKWSDGVPLDQAMRLVPERRRRAVRRR